MEKLTMPSRQERWYPIGQAFDPSVLAINAEGDNCGTGAGGFKKGNKCAGGGKQMAARSEVDRIREVLPSPQEWKIQMGQILKESAKQLGVDPEELSSDCESGMCTFATPVLQSILASHGIKTWEVDGGYDPPRGPGSDHVYLKTDSGVIIDPTETQFRKLPPGHISIYLPGSEGAKRYIE
jgi:hypothetical protein